MNEIKEILNFHGYFVDKEGNIYSAWKRIRSLKGYLTGSYISNKIQRKLKPSKNKDGYLIVNLYINKKSYLKKISRLILETFVGPCPPCMEACHNDGNPGNNNLDNLRWDTHKNNMRDRKLHGNDPLGEKCGMSKLNELQVRIIKKYPKYWGSQKDLAEIFNISNKTISSIINNKRWKYI